MLHTVDYLLITAYLAATMFLGFFLQKRASRGIDAYFLGDRGLPWWALGASGMASNVDVAGTMVITALIYTLGAKGFFIELRGGVVLILAFFMIFMGKWTRRAGVMTTAEWMRLRFGDGREGRIARLISAVANLIITVWIISYFAVGGGKFFGIFLGVEEQWASIAMIAITMIYSTASGFYGVVWTDVFQGFIILIGVVYIVALALGMAPLPEALTVSVPTGKNTFEPLTTTYAEWSNIFPSGTLNLPGQYSVYNLFAVTIFFYFLKTCIEGFGGAGGYMSQRYFAARTDREAGLLTILWIFLLAFRWPLVTALAVLGLHYGLQHGSIADPELVLPTVISHYAPMGMKGILVACFMAAAMSTFCSVMNAGAAYWVKDIYQGFLNPNASERQLIRQGRLATILVVALGILLSFPVVNINDIWGWITMAFGSGLFVPLLLRWYWWRYNGYGFAVGTVAGMVAAVGMRFGGVNLPDYLNFLIPGGCSLIGCLIGTYLAPATDPAVLKNFFSVTRPFGAWAPIRAELPENVREAARREARQDLIAVLFAVPWQISLCLLGVTLVMKRWDQFAIVLALLAFLSAGLYLVWYRRLSPLAEGQTPQQSEVAKPPLSGNALATTQGPPGAP